MSPNAVSDYLVDLQNRIAAKLESIDGKTFRRDRWQRAEGGGGETRVMEDGNLFERGGVSFSRVHGEHLPAASSAARSELAGRGFEAMGVSLVLHPRNPYVPTVHINVRFLLATKPGSDPIWWFGGGMDLTPYYGFEDDARHFHLACRQALDPFGGDLYPRFKRWCDEYFYLKHRGEPRGIGGIFFYDLSDGGFERCFGLQRSVGDHFLPAYLPVVERHISAPGLRRDWVWRVVSWPSTKAGSLATLVMLPPVLRWRLGVEWGPSRERRFRAMAALTRRPGR